MYSIAVICAFLFCYQVHAEQEKRPFDIILESLGFGQCTDQPERCGYKDRGYAMIRFDDDSGLCTEICSSMPYLNFGYQCGACTTCPDDDTIPCLQGLGVKMFQIDNGQCNEICVFGSIRREGYSCGACENIAPTPTIVSPIQPPTIVSPMQAPTTLPTRQPVVPPIPVTVPVSVPLNTVTPTRAPITLSNPITVPITPPVPVANPTSLSYQITLDLVNMDDGLRASFQEAAGIWERVVTRDLPDVQSSEFNSPPIFPECSYPDVVDDLYICAALVDIDGLGNVAGSALPTFARVPSQGSLPSAGAMRFDTADIGNLREQGLTLPLLAHEMGHVLGIGSTWEFFGLIGNVADGCPYMGTNATAEYRSLTGCDTIPIEQEGSAGTSCRHWSETCLNTELMSPELDLTSNPLSRITIASLADLGYSVDYSSAEQYARDKIDPTCLCNRRQLLRQNSKQELSDSNYKGKHGDVTFLNELIPDPTKGHKRERRKLNEDLRQYAISYGLQILNENAARTSWASAVLDLQSSPIQSRTPTEHARYVGKYYMSVIMRQDDDYFGVLVVRDAD